MFHHLEPPCCMRWLTNLPYNTYVSLPARGTCVWCGNHGLWSHEPCPLFLIVSLCLLILYVLEIFVKHDSGQDLWFICVWYDILILCVSSENHNQHFLKMKKDITEIGGHHNYRIVLWRLPQDSHLHSHSVSHPNSQYAQSGKGKYISYCGLWIRVFEKYWSG